jgi:hypothetical protein
VARFTPLSMASSKLFFDDAMISVTRATDDMFDPNDWRYLQSS